jgi:hypothetical protein
MRVLKQSMWDTVPIALSLLHGALVLLVPSTPVIALGLWWNSNTISHNFIHSPFFRSRSLNTIYAGYLTLLLGIPQSLWRERHLAHHGGKALPRMAGPIAAETLLVFGMWSVLFSLSPGFFLGTYIPGYLAGLGLCYLHGYFEHVRGTTSNYGLVYNIGFLNDGYHVEHHAAPGEHWSRLPQLVRDGARTSRFPAVFRWLEAFNLEMLERAVLRSAFLQQFLLKTHERALRSILRDVTVQDVTIVGGGMFPRTALIIRKLLPAARITIVDRSLQNLARARTFLDDGVHFVHENYRQSPADLVIVPLAFVGDRGAIYARPPGRITLIHDWAWARHTEGVMISWLLFKRLNVVRQ